ncbi:MAG: hypothetical protein U0326_40900 [Polyangiales bacterium]
MKRLALLGACLVAVSCGTPPEQDACASIVDVTAPGASDGHDRWIVGGWTSDRVHFTALTTFAIPHGLMRAPNAVRCQVSFSADGPLAEQSGSVCLWLTQCGSRNGRTDREVIIRNSGSENFWARFIIE